MEELRFGSRTLQPRRELLADGEHVPLGRRALDIISVLAEAHGEIVTKDELLAAVWPGVTVEENALQVHIVAVRKALGPEAHRLKTIRGVGYRLENHHGPDPPAPPPSAPATAERADSAGLMKPQALARGEQAVRDDEPAPAFVSSAHASMPRHRGGAGTAERRSTGPWVSRRTTVAGAALAIVALGGIGAVRLTGRTDSEQDQRVAHLLDRGRQAVRDELPDGTQQGIGFLREVLRLDPESAAAWGLLALAYRNVAEFAPEADIAPAVRSSEQAARRALGLDPEQAEAHAALATLPPIFGDWLRSETRLRSVHARFPRQIDVIGALGLLMMSVGRVRDASGYTARAVELDPLSPIYQYRRAYHLWSLGESGEADRHIDRAMQLWPTHPAVWFARFLTFAGTHRPEPALRMLSDAQAGLVLSPAVHSCWRHACRAMAATDPVEEAVEAAMEAARESGSACINAILALSLVGRLDQAFVVADGYLLHRGPLITSIGELGGTVVNNQRWRKTMMLFTPATAPMRADLRFARLIEDIGLAGYWRAAGVRPDYLTRS